MTGGLHDLGPGLVPVAGKIRAHSGGPLQQSLAVWRDVALNAVRAATAKEPGHALPVHA